MAPVRDVEPRLLPQPIPQPSWHALTTSEPVDWPRPPIEWSAAPQLNGTQDNCEPLAGRHYPTRSMTELTGLGQPSDPLALDVKPCLRRTRVRSFDERDDGQAAAVAIPLGRRPGATDATASGIAAPGGGGPATHGCSGTHVTPHQPSAFVRQPELRFDAMNVFFSAFFLLPLVLYTVGSLLVAVFVGFGFRKGWDFAGRWPRQRP